MKRFLSCDWGTSSFRLKLVEPDNFRILAEQSSHQGIASVFQLWKQSGLGESGRLSFFLSLLREQIIELERSSGMDVSGVPVLLSGMASSSIGMLTLPYKEAPFAVDGSDLITEKIPASENFHHDLLIISGVKTEADVMRGEETQLVGSYSKESDGRQVFIFPGTHSKHVFVENSMTTTFTTFMTGEFFDLLSQKSIMADSVEQGGTLDQHKKSFIRGVHAGEEANLLHSSFLVRTNQLFGKYSKQENYYYLSGLLIGSELRELHRSALFVSIVGNELLNKSYEMALNAFGFRGNVRYLNAQEAVIKGQHMVFNRNVI